MCPNCLDDISERPHLLDRRQSVAPNHLGIEFKMGPPQKWLLDMNSPPNSPPPITQLGSWLLHRYAGGAGLAGEPRLRHEGTAHVFLSA